ncbi:hypothetical protein ACFW04_009852 [Cataglyphis niger]
MLIFIFYYIYANYLKKKKVISFL